ncbi:YabP/YqfC family sporulation protein [Eubacteriales bacterium OttesenSCG-928-N13]|nr:YabP/YqfC family sporulation protein [Eubacteriales bacterium OttesenSCG-928-N13]
MPQRTRIKPMRQGFPALEWLEQASGSQPRVMLAGGRRAMIENHTGIIEFDEQRVRLMTKQGVLTLHGQGLMLAEVRPDALTVRGIITAVELPSAQEEDEHGG